MHITVPTVTAAPQSTACVDHLPNCANYGASACTGVYQPWAMDNCRKTCGLCPGGSMYPVV